MSELRDLIPAPEPAQDALALVGGMALDALPGAGPILSRALDHLVGSRAARRRYEFDLAVVEAIRDVVADLEAKPTIDDIVQSDEFVASYTRASRAAAETASAGKRLRLARGVASSTVPSEFKVAELDAYTQLIENYDDLRIWLIAFYCDPEEWLRANGKGEAADPQIRGGRMDEPLRDALGVDAVQIPAIVDAVSDLQRDSVLGAFLLETMRSDRGQFNSQTTARGRRLLRFIREFTPETADPPSVL